MKITQDKAIMGYRALLGLGEKVTGSTAFDLFLLKGELKTVFDFRVEEENKLIDKCGGKMTEEGRVIFADPKKRILFEKESAELDKMEHEIKNEVTILLSAAPTITMQEIEALDGIVTFKKG